MRAVALLGAAALLATSIGSPVLGQSDKPPSPAMRLMEDYCVRYGGRQIDIITAADQAGLIAPAVNSAQAPGWLKLAVPVARVTQVQGQVLLLITGKLIDPDPGTLIPGSQGDICIVVSEKPVPDLSAEVGRWLGLPGPAKSVDEDGLYVFNEGPAGRQLLGEPDDAETAAILKETSLRALMFGSAPKGAMLAYVALHAPPEPTNGTAGGPFADFKNICVANGGRPADSLKAAEAAGWMDVPQEPREPPYPYQTVDVRLKSTDNDLEIFLTGPARMGFRWKELKMELCSIAQAPPNDTDFVNAVEDWTGVPPAEVDPGGMRFYFFTEQDGRHIPLSGDAEAALMRKSKSGPVSIVIIERSGATADHAFVSYGQITKVTEAALPSAYAMADER